MSKFNIRFKELRTMMKWTQTETAAKLGCSKSTISMYESGSREPDYETLEKIADLFNVDIDYLIGRSDKTTFLPNSTTSVYYNDSRVAELAQFAFDHPEYGLLFDASKKVKPEDIEQVLHIIKTFTEE